MQGGVFFCCRIAKNKLNYLVRKYSSDRVCEIFLKIIVFICMGKERLRELIL